ncbi:PREDICTED: cholinesterase 1-like [Branchiostoma belcheri]|uniref:Carboxylic ester hydrolase n=1 Tax=Branchiostoma belcheri TaxID=7741 RepID=A0A6P5AKV5_BRABE|nr:PREDICTED: cholinesterase 1-like [Branchiostoma belcheri]
MATGMYQTSAMSLWFLPAVFTAVFGPVAVQAAADVTAPAGRVAGLEQDVDGTTVNAFLGIPFAHPPVGDRRFRRAERLQRDQYFMLLLLLITASRKPNACIQAADRTGGLLPDLQVNTPLSEDCLYLNVWQPSPAPTAAAVMVWFHGGGFSSGTSVADGYDGRYLAATEGVLVVSVNYRLSTLGFAYAGTEDAPGNMGLTDQLLALQWLQDNVASFGGDPDKVTIFGESAGGMSAAVHLLSPQSRDAFNRAIMQSGTAVRMLQLYSTDDMHDNTKALAGSLGCPTEQGPTAMMACLREQDAESLVAGYPPIYPVIDGSFIPEKPEKALSDGQFKHTDILLGSNANEGMLFLLIFRVPGYIVGSENSIDRDQFIQNIKALAGLNGLTNELAVEAVAFQYTDWLRPEDGNMYRDALDAAMTDQMYRCPAFSTARAHTRAGTAAYVYEFAHRPSNSLTTPDWTGVIHSAEIQFAFGRPLNAALGYTAEEADLSRRMMRYWANFARTGNPNNDTETVWSPYTESSRGYLMLDTGAPRMVTGQKARECALWENFVPDLLNTTGLREIPNSARQLQHPDRHHHGDKVWRWLSS